MLKSRFLTILAYAIPEYFLIEFDCPWNSVVIAQIVTLFALHLFLLTFSQHPQIFIKTINCIFNETTSFYALSMFGQISQRFLDFLSFLSFFFIIFLWFFFLFRFLLCSLWYFIQNIFISPFLKQLEYNIDLFLSDVVMENKPICSIANPRNNFVLK